MPRRLVRFPSFSLVLPRPHRLIRRMSSSRRRLRMALLIAIAILYAVSIPWYRSGGETLRVWFGLPDWVAVALGAYALAACLNALAWLLTDIPEGNPEPGEEPR